MDGLDYTDSSDDTKPDTGVVYDDGSSIDDGTTYDPGVIVGDDQPVDLGSEDPQIYYMFGGEDGLDLGGGDPGSVDDGTVYDDSGIAWNVGTVVDDGGVIADDGGKGDDGSVTDDSGIDWTGVFVDDGIRTFGGVIQPWFRTTAVEGPAKPEAIDPADLVAMHPLSWHDVPHDTHVQVAII